MPCFEYACPKGHVTEDLKKADVAEITCPVCGLTATRQMSRPGGFDLRGAGFYKTDYGSAGGGCGGGGSCSH